MNRNNCQEKRFKSLYMPIHLKVGFVSSLANCDFTMDNLMLQLENAFRKITAKTCQKIIKKYALLKTISGRMMQN